MQLESLKMFCDVVETGSFSRAAQINHVTQSAVSQQIRALETRYEQRLLSRSARQVTPTPAGERLFRGCKEILSRFTEVEAEIREQAKEVQGTTTVSTIYTVGLHELQAIQRALLKTHPKVNMRLVYRRSDQVYDDVILGAAEIGLVAYPQPRAGVDIHPWREDRLGIVVPPNHPLATKSRVSLTALAGLPFIAFDREAPTRKAVDKLLRDKGVEVQPIMEMDNVETIKRAVEMGLGVAILPVATVAHEVSQGMLVCRPARRVATRPIGLLIRKGKYLDRASVAVLEAFKQGARPPRLRRGAALSATRVTRGAAPGGGPSRARLHRRHSVHAAQPGGEEAVHPLRVRAASAARRWTMGSWTPAGRTGGSAVHSGWLRRKRSTWSTPSCGSVVQTLHTSSPPAGTTSAAWLRMRRCRLASREMSSSWRR